MQKIIRHQPFLAAAICIFLFQFILILIIPPTAIWPAYSAFQHIPFILFFISFLLGICFRQTKISFLSLLISTAVFAIRSNIGKGDSEIDSTRTAITIASIYIPTFHAIFYHLKERGFFTIHGGIRLAIVISSVIVIILFSSFNFSSRHPKTDYMLLNAISETIKVPPIGIVVFLVCIPLLFIKVPDESPLLGPLLALSAINIFIALNYRSSLLDPRKSQLVLNTFSAGSAIAFINAVLESAWRSARIDELTGLPGRRALKEHMASLGNNYIIAIADIDHFKKINDKYGHDTGDQVLRFIASFLKNFPHGTAYRYGGEEFVLICGKNSFSTIIDSLENLRQSIAERPFAIRSPQRPSKPPENVEKLRTKKEPTETIQITISIGACANKGEYSTPTDALAAADNALYQAKKQGRNRVRTAR